MNILLIIYANKDHPGLQNLVRSLDNNNYSYKIIGMGDKWENYKTLMKSMVTALSTLPKDGLVCKIDAFDAFAAASPEELVEKLRKFSTPMVAGAESIKTSYPKSDKWYAYYNINPKELAYPYFNAGCIMGKASALRDYYQWLLDNDYTDDQVGLNHYADLYPHLLSLDSKQSLVGNVTIFDSLKLRDGRVYNEKTGEWPVFVHIPGAWWDFWRRMNKYGGYLLKDEYVYIPVGERIKMVSEKLQLVNVIKVLGLFLIACVIIKLFF